MRRRSPWAMSPNIQSFFFPFRKTKWITDLQHPQPPNLPSPTTTTTNYSGRGERLKSQGRKNKRKKSHWVTAVYRSAAQELDVAFVPSRWTLLPLRGKRRHRGGITAEAELRGCSPLPRLLRGAGASSWKSWERKNFKNELNESHSDAGRALGRLSCGRPE